MSVSTDRKSVHVRIEGRVQGVGYRAWTERSAVGLGLDGWVRNRRDGGVEAVFAGAPLDVEDMVRRCHEGPGSAIVSMVKVLDGSPDVPQGFRVLSTV